MEIQLSADNKGLPLSRDRDDGPLDEFLPGEFGILSSFVRDGEKKVPLPGPDVVRRGERTAIDIFSQDFPAAIGVDGHDGFGAGLAEDEAAVLTEGKTVGGGIGFQENFRGGSRFPAVDGGGFHVTEVERLLLLVPNWAFEEAEATGNFYERAVGENLGVGCSQGEEEEEEAHEDVG